MKKSILVLSILLVGMTGMNSCDADFIEPASRKTGYVNTVRKDDIAFKLSLLNEEGKPVTIFREGENFSFHFEMENLRKNDKRECLYAPLLHCELQDISGFSSVFTSNNELAYPVEKIACSEVLSTQFFNGENRIIVETNPPVVLPKGTYSTGFTHTFRYRISPEWDGIDVNAIPPEIRVEVGPVTMRINFTIE